MLSQTFNHIDWRAFAGALAIIAALFALIAWQAKGSAEKCRGWLGSSAMSLEALAMAMAVYWSIRQGSGVLTLFFALGFVGLTLSKAVTVSAVVEAWRNKKTGAGSVLLFALIGAYLTVYGAGTFEGTLHSATKHSEAAAASAPVQAVEAQLSIARQQADALSAYADASRAQQETDAANAAMQAAKAERNRVMQLLDAERATLAACPSNYVTKCIKPARARIAELEREFSSLDVPTGSDYAARHAEYMGKQAHIANLEEKRASLLSSGASTGADASADDRLIKWLFNLDTIEQASSIKWLVFVAVFDVLSLLLRLGGELLAGRDIAKETAQKIRALIDAGISPDEAVSFGLGGGGLGGMQAAQVKPHGAAVSGLLTGGSVLSDGLVNMHAGETVLNPGASAEIEILHPGLVEQLNAKHNAARSADKVSAGTVSAVTPSAVTPSAGTVSVQFVGLERVPDELSGKAGRGRVGKVDACTDCGQDFQVKTYNGTRCPKCSEQNKARYVKAKVFSK